MTSVTISPQDKPISETVTVSSGSANLTDLFTVPHNRIAFLDFIEVNHTGVSGATLTIWDTFEDTKPSPTVSGIEDRKEIFVASGTDERIDVQEDVPILEQARIESTISGFTATVSARTI